MSQSVAPYEAVELNQMIGSWMVASNEGQSLLESELLPRWLLSRRWFGGKSRPIARVTIDATVLWPDLPAAVLAIAVHYAGHTSDRYLLPLAYGPIADFDECAGVIAKDSIDYVLSDAVYSPAFRANLLALICSGSVVASGENSIGGKGSRLLRETPPEALSESRILSAEQSNTSVLYGGRMFLKLFRRLDSGINPDAEITRFLSERQGFAHVPPYAGELELRMGSENCPMALMLGAVENRGDAWSWALAELGKFYAGENPSETYRRVANLGEVTAEMHLALAADLEDEPFKPEPLTLAEFDELAASVTARLDALTPALHSIQLAGDALAAAVLGHQEILRDSIARLRTLPPGTTKIRHHGDYHLGQVIDTGSEWIIIDFEGEPMRSLAERRQKRSPLRDVAGMLRSFHYAAHSACPGNEVEARFRAEEWSDAASSAFLAAYMARAQGAVFLPARESDRDALLRAYVLEKALYEIDYELNNRPTWLPIPLRGVLRALKQ